MENQDEWKSNIFMDHFSVEERFGGQNFFVPVPTQEEKCPVWAQVENKCNGDCN